MRKLRNIKDTFKRTLLTVLTLCVTTIFSSLFAQSVQEGIVYEYDGKKEKKPLANVEIVVNNAGSTVSDQKGQFKLNFRTLKPGDKITVRRCEKLGYEVFNTEAVSQFVITRNNEPITIVMCKSEVIKDIRDRYMNIARQNYSSRLEQEEKELKANLTKGYISKREFDKRVDELQRKYEEQLEDIDNYIDRFTHIDLTEISAIDKEVIDLINSGQVEEAISKYDDQHLLDTYRTEIKDFKALADAEARLTEATEQKKAELGKIKATIRRQVDLLWLAGGEDNFKKIVSLLHDVADADPTDYLAQLDYGDIALTQDNSLEAMNYYNKAYNAAKGDVVKEAKVMVKRGEAYYLLNNFDKAWDESMTALHNLDSLNVAQNDSDLNLADRAKAQITLAKTYNRRDEHDESLRYYSYAITEYEVLMELDSAAYAVDYADVMMRYGRELSEVNDTINAEEQMKQAIKLYETLQQINPQRNSATLAQAYSWLGELYRLRRKFDDAEFYLQQSSQLYEYVQRFNPELHKAGYAECNQDLGKLYIWMSDYEKSRYHLDKAEEIYSKLAEKNPNMYIEKVAETHLNKGTLCWFTKNYEEAKYHDSIAVKRYEELYKLAGGSFSQELGHSLYYLGDCYFQLGDYVSCNHCYRRAVKYWKNPAYNTRMEQVAKLANAKSAPKTTPKIAPKDNPNAPASDKNKKRKNNQPEPAS